MATITAPNGPFWPLGRITVATPGTPVSLTQNLSAAGKQYTSTGNSEYAAAFNKITCEAPSANTGNCYLMYPGFAKGDPNGIIRTVPSGTVVEVIASATSRNVFGFGDFLIDADTSNNYLQVTGFVAN